MIWQLLVKTCRAEQRVPGTSTMLSSLSKLNIFRYARTSTFYTVSRWVTGQSLKPGHGSCIFAQTNCVHHPQISYSLTLMRTFCTFSSITSKLKLGLLQCGCFGYCMYVKSYVNCPVSTDTKEKI